METRQMTPFFHLLFLLRLLKIHMICPPAGANTYFLGSSSWTIIYQKLRRVFEGWHFAPSYNLTVVWQL